MTAIIRKTTVTVLMLVMGIYILKAQDIITMRDCSTVEAQVSEITDSIVTYKREDLPDGPVFKVSTDKILSIRLSTGTMRYFDSQGGVAGTCGEAQPADRFYTMSPDALRPNMSYRELRKIYKVSSWDGYTVGDPYYGQWRLSSLLPGLGQIAMGEPGRGYAFLCSEIGCFALIIAGLGLVPNISSTPGGAIVGMFMTPLVGGLVCIGIGFWSVADAMQMAKSRPCTPAIWGILHPALISSCLHGSLLFQPGQMETILQRRACPCQ